MPCSSDYLEPTQSELNSKEVAQHLIYVKKKLDYIELPEYVYVANSDSYGYPKMLDDMVVLLCDLLSTMRKVDLEEIVYNAKCKESRKLADWWEEHQEADKKRKLKENKEKEKIDKFEKNKKIVEEMKNKGVLHDYEWEALEQYFKNLNKKDK